MNRISRYSVRMLALGGLAAITIAAVVMWRGSRAIRLASEDVQAEHEFRYLNRPLVMPVNPGFEVVSSPQSFSQAASFQDHLYVAGPTGLSEYDTSGSLLHVYMVGGDLPASPLIALSTGVLADSHEAELLIATASDGLMAFNGRSFRQIRPEKDEARAVTAILPVASGHLLFGTKKRGVLVYDGKHIRVLHPQLDSAYVTALAGSEADL